MPTAEGGVSIASSSVNPRSPFAQHTFVGANTYLLRIFEQFGEELGATASASQFGEAGRRTEVQLAEQTANVTIENIRLSGVHFSAEVVVEDLAGHKFPTGFPSRRAWLHITLRDASGQVLFESGGYGPDGSITGNDNDADPSQFEPHYQAIVSPDQVQIYEAILRDSEGAVTTQLVRAAGYLKDNRLLPWGFEKGAPYEDIAVRGQARDDENFLEGGDRVLLDLPLGGSSGGPYSLQVELLYQPVGYRWIENLRGLPGAEIDRFMGYTAAVPNVPVVVASAEIAAGQ